MSYYVKITMQVLKPSKRIDICVQDPMTVLFLLYYRHWSPCVVLLAQTETQFPSFVFLRANFLDHVFINGPQDSVRYALKPVQLTKYSSVTLDKIQQLLQRLWPSTYTGKVVQQAHDSPSYLFTLQMLFRIAILYMPSKAFYKFFLNSLYQSMDFIIRSGIGSAKTANLGNILKCISEAVKLQIFCQSKITVEQCRLDSGHHGTYPAKGSGVPV